MPARLPNIRLISCLLAAIVLPLLLTPALANAADPHDPQGKVADLKRVSAYTDEELKSITEMLVKGTIKIPPGTKVAERSVVPKGGPPLARSPGPPGMLLVDTSAGYQEYGPEEQSKPDRSGGAVTETWSIPHLVDNSGEWMVLHQWGKRVDNNDQTENAIAVWRNGNKATFKFYVSSLGGYQDADAWERDVDHTFELGVQALHSSGSTQYDQVFFGCGMPLTKKYTARYMIFLIRSA